MNEHSHWILRKYRSKLLPLFRTKSYSGNIDVTSHHWSGLILYPYQTPRDRLRSNYRSSWSWTVFINQQLHDCTQELIRNRKASSQIEIAQQTVVTPPLHSKSLLLRTWPSGFLIRSVIRYLYACQYSDISKTSSIQVLYARHECIAAVLCWGGSAQWRVGQHFIAG